LGVVRQLYGVQRQVRWGIDVITPSLAALFIYVAIVLIRDEALPASRAEKYFPRPHNRRPDRCRYS
jgi:hypothetical protein